MATFGDAERNIQRLLAIGQSFVLSGVDYIIRKSGKPTCSKGEPKTDIYVLAESKDRALLVEIKISFKKENADFTGYPPCGGCPFCIQKIMKARI